jgi:DNA-directed RNA polymerase I subunit RPA43
MASAASPETAIVKKEKKEKKDKSAKKRAREEDQDATGTSERKHKKSKSIAAEPTAELLAEIDGEGEEKKKKNKSKKKKARTEAEDDTEPQLPPLKTEEEEPDDEAARKEKKKEKKRKKENRDNADDAELPTTNGDSLKTSDKKEKKKKKKSKPELESSQIDEATSQAPLAAHDPDAMDIDSAPAAASKSSSSTIHAPSDIPPDPVFPFFNQTVSLYQPILPSGWGAPITACESQHLRHLHNRYVPELRGVLLDYTRVTLNEQPGRDGAATTDTEPAMLTSKAEFGGGFGWITADVKLFVPSRGAWMEGSVNLQTEGHIGVVCFGRFNASIEASRLPPTWAWVPNEQAETGFEETASVITGADEHGVVRQIHSTGYWVDELGAKIKGKVRFRIRNFDVGVSGNSTFLSLQGTMLDRAGEKALVAKEAKEARTRKLRKGGGGVYGKRRVPEFSMTRFESEEDQAAKTPAEDEPVVAPVAEGEVVTSADEQ